MFGTKSHSNYTGGNAPKRRPSLHQSQRGRNCEGRGTTQDAADHIVLHEDLQPLRDARRELPASLNCGKVAIGERARAQLRGQNVGCSNRVLNCKVDSYSSNGRHCVGGIADAKKSGTPPLPQAVDLDREQAYIVPVPQFTYAVT